MTKALSMFLYTLTMQLWAGAVLTAARPFGRLTAADQEDYFDRLARTTLQERRVAAFTRAK